MMRLSAFHGTNSITCANSVLPWFMLASGSIKPEPEPMPATIQIVDILKPAASARYTISCRQS